MPCERKVEWKPNSKHLLSLRGYFLSRGKVYRAGRSNQLLCVACMYAHCVVTEGKNLAHEVSLVRLCSAFFEQAMYAFDQVVSITGITEADMDSHFAIQKQNWLL